MNMLERELLEQFGLEAVPAYSGTEALRRFEQCHADAVLLDLMLPEMDGYEVCAHLRHNGRPQVPIVVVTALDDEASRRRAAEVGASAYFVKPFDCEAVGDAIRTLVNAEVQDHPTE
jgi:CheY-like chemotaxis protein